MKEGDLDPETVRLLKEYLREAREEGRSKKEDEMLRMLRESRDWQMQHAAENKEEFAEMRGAMKSVSLRVGALEEDVRKLESSLEDTGRHNITRLELELERERRRSEKRRELAEARRYNATEWVKQNWIPILISVLSLAVAAYQTFRR